jgi:hypothetical protein
MPQNEMQTHEPTNKLQLSASLAHFNLLLGVPIFYRPKRTPCSRVLLEKLIITRLVNKNSASYGIWRFITVLTKAGYSSLSWARYINSTPSHSIYVIFPSRFYDRTVVRISHISHACYTPLPSHPPWSDHPNNTCEEYKLWSPLITLPNLYLFLSRICFHNGLRYYGTADSGFYRNSFTLSFPFHTASLINFVRN